MIRIFFLFLAGLLLTQSVLALNPNGNASGQQLTQELFRSGRLGLSDIPARSIFLSETCDSVVTQNGTIDDKLKLFCEVVTKSDHCKDVPPNELLNCLRPQSTPLAEGLDFLKGCAVGVFHSARDLLSFIWEAGKFIWENITDMNRASQSLDKASQFANSIKLYIYTEYDKAYDSAATPKGINAGRAVAEKMLSFVVNKLMEMVKESYYEFGCLNTAAKSERVCKLMSDFILPPAALFAFLKRGALAAKSFPGIERGLARLRGYSKLAPYIGRLGKAERLLGKTFSVAEQEAIIAAHLVGAGESGLNGSLAKVGNYTQGQIRKKAEILRRAGFSSQEIRRLMEEGIVGLDASELRQFVSVSPAYRPPAPASSAPRIAASGLTVSGTPRVRVHPSLEIGAHPESRYESVRKALREGKVPQENFVSFQAASGDRFAGKIEAVNAVTGEVTIDIGQGVRLQVKGEQLATIRTSEISRIGLGATEKTIKLEPHPEPHYQVVRDALNRGEVPVDPYVSFQSPESPRLAAKIEAVNTKTGEVSLLLEDGSRRTISGDTLQTLRQSSTAREAMLPPSSLPGTAASREVPSARSLGELAIDRLGLGPKYSVAGRNVQYKVSDFFTDGDGRVFVITDVTMNGQTFRRVFYRSNSSASFRNLPARNKGIPVPGYDKGPGEEFLAAAPELQAFLAGKLETAPALDRLPKLDPEKLEGVIPVNRNFQDYLNYSSNPQGINNAFQGQDILGNVERRLTAGNGTNFARPQDVQIAHPLDRPDFSRPNLSYKLKTDLYGEVDAFVYRSQNGDLDYTLLRDRSGKVWFSDVGSARAEINQFGLRSKGINSEELLMPRWEYSSQIPEGFSGNLHPQNSQYQDSWKYIREMPEIQRWYREQNLPIPP